MAGNRKKKKLTLLGNDFAQIYSQQHWGNRWHLFTLVCHWEDVVGKETASCSMPAYFRGDVLWIYVQGSIRMQEMQLAKVTLLEKINAFLEGAQRVVDLRWVQQPNDLIDVPSEQYVAQEPKVDPSAEKKFRMMAETIDDAACRESLCNLWRYLNSKNSSD